MMRCPQKEVSLKTTFIRTMALLVLTFIFCFGFRSCPLMVRLLHQTLSSPLWQRLYDLTGAETALAREQLILSAIVGVSFSMAFGVLLIIIGATKRLEKMSRSLTRN